MLQTVHQILGAIVGFIYLHLKYPKRAVRLDVLDNDYNNAYSNAGSIILLNSIYIVLGAFFGLFILLMMGRGLISVIQNFI
jgi:hypothetical protein